MKKVNRSGILAHDVLLFSLFGIIHDDGKVMPPKYLKVQYRGEEWRLSGNRRYFVQQDPVTDTNGRNWNLSAGWEWLGDSVRALSDPNGFIPIFYHASQSEFVISTSLLTVMEHLPEAALDWDALSVFMRVGFFLGTDTPIAGIRVLPPNARLYWSNGSLQVDGGIKHPKPLDILQAEAVDCYAALFRAAIRRRPPGDDAVVVPLSGGRDSRHIIYEMHAAGWRPAAVLTGCQRWPPERDGEGQPAILVARHLGLEQAIVRIFSSFSGEMEKNHLTHFCADEHGWYLSLAQAIRGRFAVVYDGLAGDVLSNGLGYTPKRLALFRRGDLAPLADDLLGPATNIPYLSRDLARRLDYERARARLVAELQQHQDAPNPVSSFLFWNRTRREIGLAPLCMLGDGIRVQVPYMDAELVTFLHALPAERFGMPGFHDQVIAQAFPQFADIPFEGKTTRSSSNYGEALRIALEIITTLPAGRGTGEVNWRWALSRSIGAVLTGQASVVSWWSNRLFYFMQLRKLAGFDGSDGAFSVTGRPK
jgi:asparagine synthase (glutamine-hydrolysing)